jgi:tetratricopeptide (TPR) repeat protein
MSQLRNRDRHRTFYETLEDRPPASRFLLAANPPAHACSADVRSLVKKSFGLRYSDLSGMFHYAKLARCLADALPQQDPESQNARGEACIQFGNVLRILGHFPSALQIFKEAEMWLSKGTRPSSLFALLWEVRGSLYRDWREFAQSEKCLATAARFHLQSGDDADSNRCLVTRAICAGEGGDPNRAVRLAERAIQEIDWEKQPDLAMSAVHVMCWFLVDAGQPVLALACSVEAEPLFAPPLDELISIRRTWLQAHIHNALGLYISAEILYRRAAEGYARQELHYERTLVLLDLCMPLAAQNRLDELASVAADILPEFERIGIGREATASRILLAAATQASIANRLKDIEKVSRLVQQALPPAQKLPEL